MQNRIPIAYLLTDAVQLVIVHCACVQPGLARAFVLLSNLIVHNAVNKSELSMPEKACTH